MDTLIRFSKASFVWLLYWPFAIWQAAGMSTKVFREAYRANSINPRDWAATPGLVDRRRKRH